MMTDNLEMRLSFFMHRCVSPVQMVQDPTQFDVLVMPNLYGDILRFVPRPV